MKESITRSVPRNAFSLFSGHGNSVKLLVKILDRQFPTAISCATPIPELCIECETSRRTQQDHPGTFLVLHVRKDSTQLVLTHPGRVPTATPHHFLDFIDEHHGIRTRVTLHDARDKLLGVLCP